MLLLTPIRHGRFPSFKQTWIKVQRSLYACDLRNGVGWEGGFYFVSWIAFMGPHPPQTSAPVLVAFRAVSGQSSGFSKFKKYIFIFEGKRPPFSCESREEEKDFSPPPNKKCFLTFFLFPSRKVGKGKARPPKMAFFFVILRHHPFSQQACNSDSFSGFFSPFFLPSFGKKERGEGEKAKARLLKFVCLHGKK